MFDFLVFSRLQVSHMVERVWLTLESSGPTLDHIFLLYLVPRFGPLFSSVF